MSAKKNSSASPFLLRSADCAHPYSLPFSLTTAGPQWTPADGADFHSFFALSNTITTDVLAMLKGETEPMLATVIDTCFGRLACSLLPIVDLDMFKDRLKATNIIVQAIRAVLKNNLCKKLCISFTGMIPAATRGLRDVVALCLEDEELGPLVSSKKLRLTTGHESVSAAFLLNTERCLQLSRRVWESEHACFVGVGHIGNAFLALLLKLKRLPASITLVDLKSKEAHLQSLQRQLSSQLGLRCVSYVALPEAKCKLPAEVYPQHSVFLLSTSSSDILDVDQLRPGSIVVDDSFPPAFSTVDAARRVEQRADILVTIAGGFEIGKFRSQPMKLVYVAEQARYLSGIDEILKGMTHMAVLDEVSMTGCVMSAMTTAAYELPFDHGNVRADTIEQQLRTYLRNGFEGTWPYFAQVHSAHGNDRYVFTPAFINQFAERFNDVRMHGTAVAAAPQQHENDVPALLSKL